MTIQFNGRDLPGWISVTGISFQTVNLSVVEHESSKRVGNIDAGIIRGGVDINVSIFISPVDGMSILQQADEIKRFLMGNNWKVSQLILLEQPDKFYNARVSNAVEVTDAFTHGESEITFLASDPKKYSVVESMTIGALGEAMIDYIGMEKTPILVEFTMPSASERITVEHIESGKKISILGSFKKDQVITIDTKNHNILMDGLSIKKNMEFQSNWISLEPGINTLRFSGNPNVIQDFTVTYRTAD